MMMTQRRMNGHVADLKKNPMGVLKINTRVPFIQK